MTMFSALASFAVVAGVLTLIPGMDTALVLRAAVTRGGRHAFATALGISSGTLLWGVAAAVGASAVLTASQLAYTVLRVAGAGYMLWLGAGLLRQSFGRRAPQAAAAVGGASGDGDGDGVEYAAGVGMTAGGPDTGSLTRSWTRGLGTTLVNPKNGVFYLATLPQFIPAHASHLLMGVLLALVHDLEGMLWFGTLILGVRVIGSRLRSGAVRRAMDRITGVVLIGFGIRLALADN
ncbi:LysE family translocator [Kitasatospora nipponensis]|uniref:LysE family translocator n=1 Tax=Kitasatospora nipponensis TaxID=258049 RepID=A0ABP4HPH8_9ACTN